MGKGGDQQPTAMPPVEKPPPAEPPAPAPINRLSGWRDALAAPKRKAEAAAEGGSRPPPPRQPAPPCSARLASERAVREAVRLAAEPEAEAEAEEEGAGFGRRRLGYGGPKAMDIPVTPFVLGQPVDDTLWGIPVGVSPSMATAYALAPVSAVVCTPASLAAESAAAAAAASAAAAAAAASEPPAPEPPADEPPTNMPECLTGDGTEMDVQHGTLTVPLLRHQRRALSWMTSREAGGSLPVGGLLADDQGLGKTLTTISLIVSSRPPPRAHRPRSAAAAGQPAAPPRMHPGGTLVVCPTSVLRQWARELASRVSSAAALSVLLYHGPGRSRSAVEVSRYDVVLTTYAIVSQELAPARGEEEMGGGVLGGITWWRVVLDEAQSIKNSRSLVAASVWALRARRRWCLSGTPLQNSVDDLFSYFRFLRYAPLDDVSVFRARIRETIRAEPTSGFATLQKVLACLMLRRTKSTMILGEPIVRLPPRTVRMRTCDFSTPERDCYARLQHEYRDKFAEFRAAGTVSNNYVNILYMLLRLRQACNHLQLAPRGGGGGARRAPPSAAEIAAARRLDEPTARAMLAAAESGVAECPLCADVIEEGDAVVAPCAALFCRQCWAGQAEAGDNDDSDPCPSCNRSHKAGEAHTPAALRAALGAPPPPAPEGGDAAAGGAAAAAAAAAGSGLGGSCKLRAVLDYLNDLRTRQGGCRPPQGGRGARGGRGRGRAGAGGREQRARAEQLRDGLRSSDAALAAALPPLPPVVFGTPVGGPGGGGGAGAEGGGSGLAEQPEKVIIFSQWTGMLNLLEPALTADGFAFRRLDGTMSLAAREKALFEFEHRPEVVVMLMSLKAAGMGINLVCANHVLLLDVWWNPTVEEQAIDRSHRIGQRRQVFVSRLTVADTVEDRILALQEHKRMLAAAAFGDGKAAKGGAAAASAASQAGEGMKSRLSVEDLLFLFEPQAAPPEGRAEAEEGC